MSNSCADSDEDKRDDYLGSRISSSAFLQIMEEAITTFMDFLKADKASPCQIIMSAFFKRNRRRGPVDPTLILLQKKVNKKVRRSGVHVFVLILSHLSH